MTITFPPAEITKKHLSTTETAKLVRRQLKEAFPETKFSVRTDKYAGGASINVSWTDGPTRQAVEAITNNYTSKNFDGMIDMAFLNSSWLYADGSAERAYCRGTEEQKGYHAEENHFPSKPGAQLVSFGADYIDTYRELSDMYLWFLEQEVTETTDLGPMGCECSYWGCGKWVSGSAFRIEHPEYAPKSVSRVCSPAHGARVIAEWGNAATDAE